MELDTLFGEGLQRNGDSFEVVGGVLQTADPASPANDTWWLKRTGSGPYEIVLCVRIAGVTNSIPLFTTA